VPWSSSPRGAMTGRSSTSRSHLRWYSSDATSPMHRGDDVAWQDAAGVERGDGRVEPVRPGDRGGGVRWIVHAVPCPVHRLEGAGGGGRRGGRGNLVLEPVPRGPL